MTMKNSVFDSITNSEDEMIKRVGIKRAEACTYLRAYIIMRLLFYSEFVISDSSINLNKAFRTLILNEEDKKGAYDLSKVPRADFGQLIENGSIRIAARDVYKGSFSEKLRDVQKSKKFVDKPSEHYTKLIDNLCKEENIYWWNADVVAQMFTKKIRKELEIPYSDDMDSFLRNLSYRLSGHETLSYNEVKKEALKICDEGSNEYLIVHDKLRASYDYNVPEVLKLKYHRFFDYSPLHSQKRDFEVRFEEEYDISWHYLFNAYAFAQLPVYDLMFLRGSSKGVRYEKALSELMDGSGSLSSFISALESYLETIDRVLVEGYNNKYIGNRPKNMIARVRKSVNDKGCMVLTVNIGLLVKEGIGWIEKFNLNPVGAITEMIGTVFLPHMIVKKREQDISLPEIKRAIIKVEE